MPQHIPTIIIGSGISGLCVAHRLRKARGAGAVCMLEASDCAGGHIQTDDVDGYLCDRGPNGFLDREPKMLEWIEELGLTSELIPANEAAAHRFLLMGGRLVEVVGPPKFLLAPLLSPIGRARLLCEPLIPQRRDVSPESIWDFAARRIGKEAADNLVSAMVLGVYGGDAKALSLAHCFPRMAAMEADHGSLFKAMLAKKKEANSGGPAGPGGTLNTLKGGIGTLTKHVANELGDAIRLNTSIKSLTKNGATYTIEIDGGDSLTADRVIVATPAFAAKDIVQNLDAELSQALGRVDYASLAVVCTGFRREQVANDLNGFGFLVPPKENKEVLGCIWTSSVFPGSAPDGKVLLRTMIGGATNPDSAAKSDDELLALVYKDVHSLLGATGEPEMVQIYRHPRGIPQYGLHHGEVLDAIDAAEARHPGLYITGNAYRGNAMIDCVVEAYRLAERIRGTADSTVRAADGGHDSTGV